MRDQIMSDVTAGLELPPLNTGVLVGHKENMFATVSAMKLKLWNVAYPAIVMDTRATYEVVKK